MKPRAWCVLLLGVGAFLLRWGLLSTRDAYMEFDEAYYFLIGRSLADGKGLAMNGLPQIAFPPLPAVLLSFLDRLFGSLLTPSRVASALFGGLLIFPAYRTCRSWLGRRAGLIAALLTATCPSLMTFVPVDIPYARRLYFGQEPLGVLLIYGTLWALLGVLKRPTPLKGAAMGTTAALAYLTRNEWILFAVASLCLVGLSALIATPHNRRRAWSALATASLALGVVAAPYPLYLQSITSSWMVSGKTGTAAHIRPTIVGRVRDNDTYAFERAHYALAPSGDRMASSYWGYTGSEAAPGLGLTPTVIAENAWTYITILLPALIPWLLWPFIILGAMRIFRGGGRGGKLTLAAIALLPLPSLVVCVALFVEPRHHVYLVPLATFVASGGVVVASRWFAHRRAWMGIAGLLSGILLVSSLSPVLRLPDEDRQRTEAGRIQSLGRFLKAELPPGEPVMSWNPAIAVWADRDWRVMPLTGFPLIMAYSLRQGVKTIVFERSIFGPLPGEPQGESSPFAIFRIAGMTPEDAENRQYAVERIRGPGLFSEYRVTGP
ncbi:MAG: ArnT family glycosyltransferase [Planctomycetota bacterium]|jgi:4-amino-4-deoxy-L-arabinose transferase-like glycosyltransferase